MIDIKNLSVSYGKKIVLKDICVQIKDGETIGLLGSNGAGKSTFMNVITGYLKPDDGEVLLDGCDMRKNPKNAKKKIGYLPEIPPLYQDMKVIEYLKFAAELKKVALIKEEVNRVIERMHLEEYQFQYIKKLSKGYRQRVGFAQALLGDPKILILDEPLVGLDPIESKHIRNLICELKQNHIILISSHILKEIEDVCDLVLILKDGTIIFEDSTKNVRHKGKQSSYRLVVKGDCDKVLAILKERNDIKSVELIGEKEPGVYEFVLKSKDQRDIRDQIFGVMANMKVSVYGIEKLESSLEDVYIEMNQ